MGYVRKWDCNFTNASGINKTEQYGNLLKNMRNFLRGPKSKVSIIDRQ